MLNNDPVAKAYVSMIVESNISDEETGVEGLVNNLRKSGWKYEFPSEPWASRGGNLYRIDLVPGSKGAHLKGSVGILHDSDKNETKIVHVHDGVSTDHTPESILAMSKK